MPTTSSSSSFGNDNPQLPPDYTLHHGTPPISQYIDLRISAGLSPVTHPQASAVATGTWYGCYITSPTNPPEEQTPPGETPTEVIGMGRIISDGGWYFHITDMAVHPQHQRKGLGRVIMRTLLGKIEECKPEGEPVVNLFADPPGRRLYEGFGFSAVRGGDGEEVGMVLGKGYG